MHCSDSRRAVLEEIAVSVRIERYHVGIHRELHYLEPHADARGLFARHLYLDASSTQPGRFRHFAIYFYEGGGPHKIGYQKPQTGLVVAFLPVHDFEPMYQVLRHEKPVYVHWSADAHDKLIWIQLGTWQIPPGDTFEPVPHPPARKADVAKVKVRKPRRRPARSR